MENPRPIPPALVKNNIYALLSPVNGALAILGGCITLGSTIIPTLPFLCGTISGLFSLGAIITGIVGLTQVRRGGQKGRGLAITGLVLGILGLLAACLIPFLGTALWAALGWEIGDLLLVPVE